MPESAVDWTAYAEPAVDWSAYADPTSSGARRAGFAAVKTPAEQKFESDVQAAAAATVPKPTFMRPAMPGEGLRPLAPLRPDQFPSEAPPYDLQRALVGGPMDILTGSGMPVNMATPPLGAPMDQSVQELQTPGKRGTGALRMAATGLEAATPLMGPAALENPASILRGLAEGTVASEAGGYGLDL